jgi:predicted HicB family RNase H-like nuclease
MMKYKGYVGKVEYDSDAKLFHGEVVGLKDTITFQATNAEDLEREFRKSIDVYLDWCKELGEKPEKMFSGKLHIRMTPDLHAHLAIEAARRGISLNDLINEKLNK